jgi:hypothetical protein
MQLAANRKHHPFLAPALELRNFQDDVVFSQLLQRRITYGNAARLLHQSWLEFKTREAQYNQTQTEGQRRALAESLDALARQARAAAPPLPGAARLSCRWVGPTLYCDAY